VLAPTPLISYDRVNTPTGDDFMGYQLKDLQYQRAACDPQVMLENLRQDLKLHVSVGIWYFTPGGGRFHDRFVPEASIEQRIDMAAEMAKFGVTGIEAHFPDEARGGSRYPPRCGAVLTLLRSEVRVRVVVEY
jgi:hypothetical protein